MAATGSPIVIEDDGPVRTITLNRPDVLNALNDALLRSLTEAVRDAEKADAVRCLIITGAGRAFSSGQDLAEVRDRYARGQAIDFGPHLRNLYNPLILGIRQIEKPVIGAINGVAAGAGCSLALACDVRVAAESASFIEAFINVGLVPDSAATFMLPRLVGISRALELAFTGRRVKADEALRIGLVNEVAPDDRLGDSASKLARKLAALPTRALGLTKRAINAGWNADLETQLEHEATLQAIAGKTHDHREGVAAFLEKRPPQFRGE